MKSIPITLIFLFSCLNQVIAQNPDELVDRFFKEYSIKGKETALNNLVSTNPWVSTSDDGVVKLLSQIPTTNNEILGPYLGYEKIVGKMVTKDYYFASFLSKYDRQYIRFTFSFYKPKKKWRLHTIAIDNDFKDELIESMKLYYQPFKEK
jgi:hypothetical protein